MTPASLAPVLDASTSETLVRFHLSLNVSDLARSRAFYRALFDVEPAKARKDYAKFELTEPPLVLSLMPGAHAGGGALNHVGMRLVDAERLVQMQARLEMAGYRTQREEGVACCYARQTKFWVVDPDRTLWEFYILHDDDDDVADEGPVHGHHGATATAEAAAATSTAAAGDDCCAAPRGEAQSLVQLATNTASCAPATMLNATAPVGLFHNLAQPLPERLEQADASVAEAKLQGTFNVPHEPARLALFLSEAFRVLRPGGLLMAHGLVTDRPLSQTPDLPGPAALVTHVPVEGWPAEALTAAGFVNVEFIKLAATPCFTVGEAELRECKVVGRKPVAEDAATAATVIYRGPFRGVTDDLGHHFARGERVAVCSATLALLQAGPLAEQFVVLDGAAAREPDGADPTACSA